MEDGHKLKLMIQMMKQIKQQSSKIRKNKKHIEGYTKYNSKKCEGAASKSIKQFNSKQNLCAHQSTSQYWTLPYGFHKLGQQQQTYAFPSLISFLDSLNSFLALLRPIKLRQIYLYHFMHNMFQYQAQQVDCSCLPRTHPPSSGLKPLQHPPSTPDLVPPPPVSTPSKLHHKPHIAKTSLRRNKPLPISFVSQQPCLYRPQSSPQLIRLAPSEQQHQHSYLGYAPPAYQHGHHHTRNVSLVCQQKQQLQQNSIMWKHEGASYKTTAGVGVGFGGVGVGVGVGVGKNRNNNNIGYMGMVVKGKGLPGVGVGSMPVIADNTYIHGCNCRIEGINTSTHTHTTTNNYTNINNNNYTNINNNNNNNTNTKNNNVMAFPIYCSNCRPNSHINNAHICTKNNNNINNNNNYHYQYNMVRTDGVSSSSRAIVLNPNPHPNIKNSSNTKNINKNDKYESEEYSLIQQPQLLEGCKSSNNNSPTKVATIAIAIQKKQSTNTNTNISINTNINNKNNNIQQEHQHYHQLSSRSTTTRRRDNNINKNNTDNNDNDNNFGIETKQPQQYQGSPLRKNKGQQQKQQQTPSSKNTNNNNNNTNNTNNTNNINNINNINKKQPPFYPFAIIHPVLHPQSSQQSPLQPKSTPKSTPTPKPTPNPNPKPTPKQNNNNNHYNSNCYYRQQPYETVSYSCLQQVYPISPLLAIAPSASPMESPRSRSRKNSSKFTTGTTINVNINNNHVNNNNRSLLTLPDNMSMNMNTRSNSSNSLLHSHHRLYLKEIQSVVDEHELINDEDNDAVSEVIGRGWHDEQQGQQGQQGQYGQQGLQGQQGHKQRHNKQQYRYHYEYEYEGEGEGEGEEDRREHTVKTQTNGTTASHIKNSQTANSGLGVGDSVMRWA